VFSADSPAVKNAERGTAPQMRSFFNASRRVLRVMNAYVFLPAPLRRALDRAGAREVDLALVTNSPKSNNLSSVRLAYEANRDVLARGGARVWEYQGPGTMHAKAAAADERYAYVGGFNLDPRSSSLNLEAGLYVDSPEAAGDVAARIEAARARSALVASEGRWLAARKENRLWRAIRKMLARLRLPGPDLARVIR
jgi:cardiolipin synthase C